MGQAIQRHRWVDPLPAHGPGPPLARRSSSSSRTSRCSSSPCAKGTFRTGFHGPPETLGPGELPGRDQRSFARQLRRTRSSTADWRPCCASCIGYPLAYTIAFRGGRYKNLLLFLVIAPFFTSFLIRTISWKIILGNDGPFLAIVRDGIGAGARPNFSVIGTPLAVVSGLTYEFLPFMVLPLYVSLEKVDRRLIEAAQDLYAGPWRPAGTIVGAIVGGLLAVALVVGLGYASLVGDAANPILVLRGVRRSGPSPGWSSAPG